MIDKLAGHSESGAPAAIGRYRIVGLLGKGGMGVVYRAHDDQKGRDVALKVLSADVEGEPEARVRFLREAEITRTLLHRNIVTILDVGEENGRLFIVMELLKGRTLGEFVKDSTPRTLEQKIDLMVQACEGLSVAHAKSIVHRDLKPGNLFVQSDGGLKILDFGIARLAGSLLTKSGLVIGTPDYLSPEQARGKRVDARADIFSVAAVFYYVFTGRKPFEGPDLMTVIRKVIREDPPPIRDHEAPAPLARIIIEALHKDPEQRYQRVADMTADLIRFKRDFDADTRQLGASAKERFDEIQRTAASARELRAALSMADSAAIDERERSTRERLGVDSGGGAPEALAPLGRAWLTALLPDLQGTLYPMTAEVEDLTAALGEVEQGERALDQRDGPLALTHFERAVQRLGAESPRVAEGQSRARALVAEPEVDTGLPVAEADNEGAS